MFVCFDILYDGTLLINLSLEERKEILEKYEDNDIFIKSKYIKKDGKKLFNIVKKMNMEGIVAKKINSKYQINERSNDWLKIKNYQKGEFVVLGYINKENSYVISLLLGERLKGKLKYVGKVSLGKKRSLANKIMNIVANYFNLSTDDLTGKRRSKEIANARMIAMYLCKLLTEETLERIGLEFGGRDHSTVIHACEKIGDDIKTNSELEKIISELKVKMSE